MLTDNFGRIHDYLRISVTDACNLNCIYCMPEGTNFITPKRNMMTAGEIDKLASVFTELGINKIRITGGEPLIRKDIRDIIMLLSDHLAELAISTNAFYADDFIGTFKAAGLNSVNVSLDSLDPEDFAFITKSSNHNKILSNIYLLLKEEFKVKVNFVVMKDVNEHAIPDFIEWTRDHSFEVRFIEFMPFDRNGWGPGKVFSYDEILGLIGERYMFEKIPDEPHDTSRKFRADGHKGTFGIISTITKPFCADCNRLRLTADGKLKNCLFSAGETDLLTPLRNGEDIVPLIFSALREKREERGGQFENDTFINRSMVSIGG